MKSNKHIDEYHSLMKRNKHIEEDHSPMKNHKLIDDYLFQKCQMMLQ
jgi:hypothetical protein